MKLSESIKNIHTKPCNFQQKSLFEKKFKEKVKYRSNIRELFQFKLFVIMNLFI